MQRMLNQCDRLALTKIPVISNHNAGLRTRFKTQYSTSRETCPGNAEPQLGANSLCKTRSSIFRTLIEQVQNSVFDLKRGNVWSKLDSLKREPTNAGYGSG